jgi:hypothetical protein
MIPERRRAIRPWCLTLIPALMAGAVLAQESARPRPVQVTIRDEKPVVVEAEAPLDPARHINYTPTGVGVGVRGEQNQILHLSHFPSFMIDGQLYQQGQGGRPDFVNRQLPRGKGRKDREGFVSAYTFGELRVTVTVTLEPTKPTARGAKRRLDAVLVHYLVENQGKQPHKFGLRNYMDTFIVNNDGCLFAAPTMPGKILDGTVLSGKQMPPYFQLLQVPDLKNPGFVAHFTLDLGPRMEKADKIVFSRFAAGINTWDMPAFQAMGDSAMAVFWEPREIKPGGKREFAYGYGQGIVPSPENEGRFAVALGGSFEPGKRFSVTAYVTDPAQGQSLTLELPEGMALVEGKACQPVPEAPGETPFSVVLWRAQVLRTGQLTLRIRSSTGVTQTKNITVTPAGG